MNLLPDEAHPDALGGVGGKGSTYKGHMTMGPEATAKKPVAGHAPALTEAPIST